MSWWDGVPASLLFGGPVQDYPAAAAASTSAQSLITGATGGFQQPMIPVGVWQMGKTGTLLMGHAVGILTGQASATTAIITLGVAAAANSVSGGTATTLVATPAITVTSLSAVGWEFDFKITNRTTGYGTTTVSTTLYSSGIFSVGTTNLQVLATPNSVSTIDASVNQYLYATVTFSTSSATNSCTLKQFPLYVMP